MRAFRIRIAIAVVVAFAPIATTTAWAQTPPAAAIADPNAGFIAEAAHRFAIPETWISATMRVESGGDPRAVSPRGAAGLMQLMPATWRDLRARYGLGDDVYDRRDNILAGTAFLRELYDRYGAPGFLAAYNAGPGRYDDHLATGRPLPAETIAYVERLAPLIGGVNGDGKTALADPLAWTRASLFVLPSETALAAGSASSDRPNEAVSMTDEPSFGGLFVRRPSIAPQP